jgi:hypothetical protein
MYLHHHRHNFISFIDSVTLAYIRKDSLKMMKIHGDMSKYFMKRTLLLIYCVFVGLNNKFY